MKGARSHYDVLILGADLSAVAAGALLARRGFRVIWVRHDARSARYAWDGLELPRRIENAAVLDTPAWNAIAAELSMPPSIRKRLADDGLAGQIVLPHHRIDIARAPADPLPEFEREFPELRRPMEELLDRIRRCDTELDQALNTEVSWPPDGFFERRATRNALAQSAMRQELIQRDPLGDFPEGHVIRTVMEAPARFALDSDPDRIDGAQLARAWGLLFRNSSFVEGGMDGVLRALSERITQFGGDLRERDLIDQLCVSGGRIEGLRFAISGELIGCGVCISSLEPMNLQALTGRAPDRALLETLAMHEPTYARYTLNVVLASSGIPPAMAHRSFLILDPRRPLSEENLLYVERIGEDPQGRVVLGCHALLPRAVVDEGAIYLERVRRRVLDALREVVPFLDSNLLAVDSPHDGLPLEDRTRGTDTLVPARWNGHAEPMSMVLPRLPDALLGLCALPHHGPLRNLYAVHRHVVPGLGEEGALLTAWNVARKITKSAPEKERLRRELWRKSGN
ncbi:MAG: hypothetical protein Q8Q09_29355 [Deltaproteobacteria bacterium]|nr:hypothetical protein [Deltaproteobacteria bacterium]